MPGAILDPVAADPLSKWGAAARYDFDNPNKWVTEESVPLLDEHVMTNEDGEPVARVDRQALEQIAANNNKRVRETGDPATLILGHTSDDPKAPEKPVKGFVVNYRVKPYKRDDKTGQVIFAIHGDYKVRPRHANVLEDYPRRSVELWWNKKELDPIALLGGTTPERDLGVVMRYARLRHVGLLGGSTPARDLGHTVKFSRRGGSVIESYELEDLLRYTREKKFYRPENFEKIKDLPGGKELWAGANDWENGFTWAAVYPKGSDTSHDGAPTKWIEVDHSKCPGCRGDEPRSRKDTKLCVDYGKSQVNKWAKSHSSATSHKTKFSKETCGMPHIPAKYAMDEQDPTDTAMQDTDLDSPDQFSDNDGDGGDDGMGAESDPLVAKVFQSKQWQELSSKLDMILQALQGEEGAGGPPPMGGDGDGMEPPVGGPGAPGGAPPGGQSMPGMEDDGGEGDMNPDEEERRDHGDAPVQFSGTGFPGPGSTSIPTFGGGKKGTPVATGKRYSRTPGGNMASPELVRMQRRQEALEKSNQALLLKLSRADAKEQIAALENEGVIFGDTPEEHANGKAEETEFLALLNDEERAQQINVIRSRYKRKKPDPTQPAFPGMARYARTAPGGKESEEEFDPQSPEQASEFADLLTLKKMSRAEAIKFMRSKR